MLTHIAGLLSRATPANPAPTLTGISGNMWICGQQQLVLTGTNFYGPITGVDINGVACTNIIHDSDTQIRVTTPMVASPGPTVPVHVVCRGGTATLAGVFQWQISPLTFESATPDPNHEGSLVTIKGTGFYSVDDVTGNSFSFPGFTKVNDRTITATLPALGPPPPYLGNYAVVASGLAQSLPFTLNIT